jgi:DNA-binding NarL/FixJ family response regulator
VISDATVRTHLGRVMTKLGLHDRSRAVTTAHKSGLVRPQDEVPGASR